ncbi:CHAP domain-containing protein [Paracoccus mangrovi]|uniref:CHAP domain-containing protein n=1 Tax=Paracoccus mangrovi TaxID=1715645 RepID=A0ABV7RCR7_9RHOB
MNRRAFFRSAAAIPAIGSLAVPVWADSLSCEQVTDFQLLRPEDDPDFGAVIVPGEGGGSPVGTKASRHSEVRTAVRIILDAPRGGGIIDTVRYFADLKGKNEDNELYSREWSVRANPLIVSFFALTGTAPSAGDQTAWCAAFLSFCLFLADKPNKFTALSGGYRTFGNDASNSPSPGDVAVFSKYGEDGTKGFGHVGFFLSSEVRNGVDGVNVIGGNQVGDTGSTGAITEAWFPLQGKTIFLHSIRRY